MKNEASLKQFNYRYIIGLFRKKNYFVIVMDEIPVLSVL